MLAADDSLKIIREFMNNGKISKKKLPDLLAEKELLIQTEDGTFTLRTDIPGELMHSRIGARTEALEKFAIPSNLGKMKSPVILDLCSGLGYNAAAALELNEKSEIHMVEYSREMVFLGTCLDENLPGRKQLNDGISSCLKGSSTGQIHLHSGDARKILSSLEPLECDVIFHDGFSPANDPVLYTVDFLELLKHHLKENGLLLSYSSSIPFRSALFRAGFHVEEGPAVGRKRGITLASPILSSLKYSGRIPLVDELLISLSTTGEPYRDPELQLPGETILKNRESERERLRATGKFHPVKKIKKGLIDRRFVDISINSCDSLESVKQLNQEILD